MRVTEKANSMPLIPVITLKITFQLYASELVLAVKEVKFKYIFNTSIHFGIFQKRDGAQASSFSIGLYL